METIWQFFRVEILQHWNHMPLKMVIVQTLYLPRLILCKIFGRKILKYPHYVAFIWMTLFYRKDNGFGRAAAFLSLTQNGVGTNRTVVDMKTVCISKKWIRNGMISSVTIPAITNLCVKSMLEINRQDFFVCHFQC